MTSDFAYVPLYRMEPVAAVGNMCCANVFTGSDEVTDSLGNQGTQRQLKRQCLEVDVVVTSCARMQIDLVMTYTYRVVVALCLNLTLLFTSHYSPVFLAAILFNNRS